MQNLIMSFANTQQELDSISPPWTTTRGTTLLPILNIPFHKSFRRLLLPVENLIMRNSSQTRNLIMRFATCNKNTVSVLKP
jgi:hypothetical protein